MKNLIKASALALLSLALPASAQQMFVSGKFQVGAQGEANYSVPIEVLPGVAGMQPSLGLSYSSQMGNGLMGMGWAVEGLSSIGRCPQTKAQDGVNKRVTYTSSDRLCLDGQRLILVAGSYGADGSEYRTEIDAQVKVVAYGSQTGSPKTDSSLSSSAPQYFKVWTKGGQIIEYGNTANSRIEAEGTTVPVQWLQNRIQDRQGNYLDWAYTETNSNGEWVPATIKYTGNLTTGAAPTNTIKFVYEARPDLVSGYSVGSKTQYIQRLSKVQVLQGSANTNIREYRLEYEQSALSKVSRLKAVRQCVGSGCLAPLQFTWSDATPTAINTPAILGGCGFNPERGSRFVDLFGDGKPVYYRRNDNGKHCATRVNADGTLKNWEWADSLSAGDAGWDVVDLFGDGKPVYYTHWYDTGKHHAVRFNADGTTQEWTWTGGHGIGDAGWKIVDLFGDGKPVYYSHSKNGEHYVTRLNPDQTLTNWTWKGHGVGDSGWDIVDLFGDGKLVYYTHSTDGSHYANRFSPTKTEAETWTWVGGVGVGDSGWRVIDLFADGKPVYYTHSKDGGHYASRLSPNDTKPKNWSWRGHGVGDAGWDIVDLFGEGKPVYYTHSNDGSHYANRFSPDQTEAETWTWTGGHGESDSGWKVVDLFGTGRPVYYTHSTNGEHYISWLNPNQTKAESKTFNGHGVGDAGWDFSDPFGEGRPAYYTHSNDGSQYVTRFLPNKVDQLTKITVAGGLSTTITYSPLTDSAVYTKDTTATYPRIDIQAPMYVVSKVQTSNGVGGLGTSSYRYGGLKAEGGEAGRGSLGFSWQEVKNEDTNAIIRTEFNQTYPYTGRPVNVIRRMGNQILSKSQTAYAYTSYTGSTKDATASLGANKRYSIFSTQSLEYSWDLNGAYIGGSRTTQSNIDDYGNVGTLKVESIDAANNALGYSKTTQSTYTNTPSNWILGRLQRTTVTNTVPNTLLTAGVKDAANAQTSGVDTFPPANRMVNKGVWLPAVLDLILQ
jgi:hypothetical protein